VRNTTLHSRSAFYKFAGLPEFNRADGGGTFGTGFTCRICSQVLQTIAPDSVITTPRIGKVFWHMEHVSKSSCVKGWNQAWDILEFYDNPARVSILWCQAPV
jgi:hypothetical protein